MSTTTDDTLTVTDHPAPRSAMVGQLPRVLAQDHFVRGYVGLCDEIWSSVLERLDDLEWFFDVGTAPIRFVQWLGRWLGMVVDPTLPQDRQRALVRTAGRTLPWRGTRQRVEQLLSALTGARVEVLDSGGVFADDQLPRGAQRVTVRLSASGGLSEAQLLDVVRAEVPANATVDLSVDAAPVGPPPADEGDDGDGVLADPEPHGDEGFLPPMRGWFGDGDAEDDDPPVTRPEEG